MAQRLYLDGSVYDPSRSPQQTNVTVEFGRPDHWDFWPLDGAQPDENGNLMHVVATGAEGVQGEVTLADGTVYDVSAYYTQVRSAEHAKAVDFHVAKKLAASGRIAYLRYGDDAGNHPRIVVVGDESGFHFAHEGAEDTPLV